MSYHTASEQAFRNILQDVKAKGKIVKPRGEEVIELEHYTYTLPPYVRFQSFESRKLSLKYITNEFLWYLRGNPMDTTICQYASMWAGLVNRNGSINSNYGQYIFGEDYQKLISDPDVDTIAIHGFLTNPIFSRYFNQFDKVIDTLTADRDSRRASIMILQQRHLSMKTNDVPCTYSLNFRIRENCLNMSVHMRSQDAIFGMGNDAPTFSLIQEMVFVMLKEVYPELELGTYYHTADSFHVYKRHYELLEKIAGGDKYIPVDCPKIAGPHEVMFLRGQIHEYYPDGEKSINIKKLDAIRALCNATRSASKALFPSSHLTELNPESFKFSTWLLATAEQKV
jgi:thymidylate synthase